MINQISRFSSFYIYKSAPQKYKFISNNSPYSYSLTLSPESKQTLNAQPRKSIKESTLETEGPLSEKDEVKQAEQRTMEQQKKVQKKQPKKDK